MGCLDKRFAAYNGGTANKNVNHYPRNGDKSSAESFLQKLALATDCESIFLWHCSRPVGHLDAPDCNIIYFISTEFNVLKVKLADFGLQTETHDTRILYSGPVSEFRITNTRNYYAALYLNVLKMADITGRSSISTFWRLSRAMENVLMSFYTRSVTNVWRQPNRRASVMKNSTQLVELLPLPVIGRHLKQVS